MRIAILTEIYRHREFLLGRADCPFQALLSFVLLLIVLNRHTASSNFLANNLFDSNLKSRSKMDHHYSTATHIIVYGQCGAQPRTGIKPFIRFHQMFVHNNQTLNIAPEPCRIPASTNTFAIVVARQAWSVEKCTSSRTPPHTSKRVATESAPLLHQLYTVKQIMSSF